MVQWLKFLAPNAGGPGSIPGQGTRSHMLPQLRLSAARYICKNILWSLNHWEISSEFPVPTIYGLPFSWPSPLSLTMWGSRAPAERLGRVKLIQCWVYQSPGRAWLSFCSFLALLCLSCSIPTLNLRSGTTFLTFSQATVTQCLLFCFGLLVAFVLISILPRYAVQTPSEED